MKARALSCLTVALFSATLQAKGPATAHGGGRSSAAAPELPRHAPEPAAAIERPEPTPPEPPPADLTEQAKQLYLLGAEAFSAQRNADAIRYFRQAERLVPSAKLTYNIALAYDEMGDAGRALSEYRVFLAREPDSLHSQEVQARIAKIEAALAALGLQQLSVSSDPPGATVWLGGEIVGVTPWAGELTPGLHRVRLERSGYQPQEAQVGLTAEHAEEMHLSLDPQRAPAGEPPGAWSRIQPLTWGFFGVGVAALAGGIGFELSRSASSDRAGRASTPESAARAQGAANAKQMASLLLLGAGTAFGVGGGVLLVLDLKREAQPSTLALSLPCAPGFCALQGQLSF